MGGDTYLPADGSGGFTFQLSGEGGTYLPAEGGGGYLPSSRQRGGVPTMGKYPLSKVAHPPAQGSVPPQPG